MSPGSAPVMFRHGGDEYEHQNVYREKNDEQIERTKPGNDCVRLPSERVSVGRDRRLLHRFAAAGRLQSTIYSIAQSIS